MQTDSSSRSSRAASISSMINQLSELHSRIQNLRHVPPLLLKSPISLSLSEQSIRSEFQRLKDVGSILRSDPIQEALTVAQDSEKADKTNLSLNGRRESRKRRRPPTPESPQPYVSYERKSASLFPKTEDDAAPLSAHGLPGYLRQFNQSRKSKLHIWKRTRSLDALENHVVVRLTAPDVFTAYMTFDRDNSVLIVEGVTAFAPRERKAPHSQSDYVVYQNLSQQITRMLQSHPRVSFQTLVDLLCSYEGLFIERCSKCGRVLSAEGHIPPTVRIWIEPAKEGERGKWDARHVSC